MRNFGSRIAVSMMKKVWYYERKKFTNRYLCEEITMRKCIRCECEMRENYDVKVEYGAYGLKITKQGIFKDNLGKVRVAVCPECGYLEFYLEDTSKLKN